MQWLVAPQNYATGCFLGAETHIAHGRDADCCGGLQQAGAPDKLAAGFTSEGPSVQVTLLDVNESAGKTLMEALEKQYGQGRTLFCKADVQSEEQLKGNNLQSCIVDFVLQPDSNVYQDA